MVPRFWFMDHTGMGRMAWESPARDGSTCVTMADSLRQVLALDFREVLGVHVDRMEREEFRKSVDATWNWLDDKSLL